METQVAHHIEEAKLPKRVLVIDDEDSIRTLLQEYLEIVGFEVQTVASGFDGLKALETRDFGLVICDVLMPGIDGYQVFERVLEARPSQNFLFITGYAFAGSNQELIDKSLGMLHKPFHLHDLHTILTELFPEVKN
ncbi:MAG: response regulator [bacterium]|nr:response regulator [bacterium]